VLKKPRSTTRRPQDDDDRIEERLEVPGEIPGPGRRANVPRDRSGGSKGSTRPRVRTAPPPGARPGRSISPTAVPFGTPFRRIPGWPCYDISPTRIVRSYYREDGTIADEPQRVLKPFRTPDGSAVTLYHGRPGSAERRVAQFPVGDLVALVWGPPRPPAPTPAPTPPRAETDPEVLANWERLARCGLRGSTRGEPAGEAGRWGHGHGPTGR
jgi:hypothetical protein